MFRVQPGKTVVANFQCAPPGKGRWKNYTSAQGLPSNQIYDLYFAPDGMLWLATQNGISSFDGLKFRNLSKRDGLIDNRVFCIYGAKDGSIWFGTETGASRFDSSTRLFQNYPSGADGLTKGRVFDIEGTFDGTLWLRTREGLSRFDGQSFREIPGIPGIPPNNMGPVYTKTKALAVDRQERVWTVTEGEDLWRVQGTNVVHLTMDDGLATRNHDALHVTPDGALWFQDQGPGFGGISRFEEGRIESFRLEDVGAAAMITAISSTRTGTMWLADLRKGVIRFNPTSHSFAYFGRTAGAPMSFVLSIQTGPDGAVWFASDSGLYRYEEDAFVTYSRADGLPEEDVSVSAVSSDGFPWFASYGNNPFLSRMQIYNCPTE